MLEPRGKTVRVPGGKPAEPDLFANFNPTVRRALADLELRTLALERQRRQGGTVVDVVSDELSLQLLQRLSDEQVGRLIKVRKLLGQADACSGPQAIGYYSRAAALAPWNDQIHMALGVECLAAGNLSEGLRRFAAGLAVNPNNEQLLLNYERAKGDLSQKLHNAAVVALGLVNKADAELTGRHRAHWKAIRRWLSVFAKKIERSSQALEKTEPSREQRRLGQIRKELLTACNEQAYLAVLIAGCPTTARRFARLVNEIRDLTQILRFDETPDELLPTPCWYCGREEPDESHAVAVHLKRRTMQLEEACTLCVPRCVRCGAAWRRTLCRRVLALAALPCAFWVAAGLRSDRVGLAFSIVLAALTCLGICRVLQYRRRRRTASWKDCRNCSQLGWQIQNFEF